MNFYLNQLTTFTFRGELNQQGFELVKRWATELFTEKGLYFEQFEKVLSTGVTRYGLEVFTTVYIYASRYCRGKFEEEVVALLRKIVNNESITVEVCPY